MHKEFIYIFSCGGRVQWSKDSGESLINRADNEDDKTLIEEFLDDPTGVTMVGSHISLSTGEMIVRTA